jgi:ABC-type transport system involved in multi-copper enzyme maturation permease subunit
MAFLRAIWLLFSTHVWRTCFSLRALLMLLLALVPIAFALLFKWVFERHDEEYLPVVLMSWLLVIQGVVPLVALIGGTGVFAAEVEDRTLSYLFVRPIPRAAVLLGRLMAVLLLVLAVVAVSEGGVLLVLQSVGGGTLEGQLSDEAASRLFATALVGAAVYTTIFAAAGTFLRHPMIVGLAYVFAIEGFLGNLPEDTQALTVQYWLKCWLSGAEPAGFQELITLQLSELDPPDEAMRTLLYVVLVALGLGSWVVSRKQYVLPS